jgi:TRAP-type mannitol/chloroaromatic compound transport system permease large subunit
MFASKVGLLLIALPVAFVFFTINIVGSYLIFGGVPGLEQMVRNEQLSVAQFSLVPIPLFVLMGEVLFHTGLAMKSVDAVDAVIHRVPASGGGGAGRRHHLLRHFRLDDRHHGDARLAAAAADARAQV